MFNIFETEGVKALVMVAKEIPYKAIANKVIDIILDDGTPAPFMGMLDDMEVTVSWYD